MMIDIVLVTMINKYDANADDNNEQQSAEQQAAQSRLQRQQEQAVVNERFEAQIAEQRRRMSEQRRTQTRLQQQIEAIRIRQLSQRQRANNNDLAQLVDDNDSDPFVYAARGRGGRRGGRGRGGGRSQYVGPMGGMMGFGGRQPPVDPSSMNISYQSYLASQQRQSSQSPQPILNAGNL